MGSNNRDLAAEAARLQQSATSARANMTVTYTERTREIEARHDALVQRQRAAQAAATGEWSDAKDLLQVADAASKRAKDLEEQSKAARDAGDNTKADELWEEHARVRTDAEFYAGRVERLTREAEKHEAEAKAFDEPITDVNYEVSKLGRTVKEAEKEIDKLEDKARLLSEAHGKATGDDPVAKLDVDDLVERADGIQVDTAKIEAVESDGGWHRPEPDETPTTPMSLPPDKPAAPKRPPKNPEHEAARDRPDVSKEKEVDLDADDAGAVRTEATAARAAIQTEYQDRATRITEVRDEAARDQWSHEQGAKAAQMQIKREQRVVDEGRARIERLNRDADSTGPKDPAMSDALREQAQRAHSDLQVAENRLAKAQSKAEELQSLADGDKRDVENLEEKYRELQTERDLAEKAVDGLEERARLLEEAKKKIDEADQSGNVKARQEAEALIERAEKVHVDHGAIERVTPDTEPGGGTTPTQGESAPVVKSEGEDGAPAAAPESASQVATSADLVGDEETDSPVASTASDAANAAGVVTQEPATDGADGTGMPEQQPLVASTGESQGDLDGTGHMVETQDANAFAGEESAFSQDFTEEQTVGVASAPAPAQDEFAEAADDGGQVV